jgi:hypothetical protein
MLELYLHSPMCLHVVVLNYLSTETGVLLPLTDGRGTGKYWEVKCDGVVELVYPHLPGGTEENNKTP